MVNSPVEYNNMVKTDCVDLYRLVGTSWLCGPLVERRSIAVLRLACS